jgi:hypothetical protein
MQIVSNILRPTQLQMDANTSLESGPEFEAMLDELAVGFAGQVPAEEMSGPQILNEKNASLAADGAEDGQTISEVFDELGSANGASDAQIGASADHEAPAFASIHVSPLSFDGSEAHDGPISTGGVPASVILHAQLALSSRGLLANSQLLPGTTLGDPLSRQQRNPADLAMVWSAADPTKGQVSPGDAATRPNPPAPLGFDVLRLPLLTRPAPEAATIAQPAEMPAPTPYGPIDETTVISPQLKATASPESAAQLQPPQMLLTKDVPGAGDLYLANTEAGSPKASQALSDFTPPKSPHLAPPTQLSQTVMQIIQRGGDGPVEMTLRPEELGSMRFEIKTGDRLHITLYVERPDAMDLIRRHGEMLLNDLRLSGFSNPTLSFGEWSRRAPPPSKPHQTLTTTDLPPALADASSTLTLMRPISVAGRLDLRL